MYFSQLKLVDRQDCSFEIPDFESEEQERAWGFTLTIGQRFELIRLLNEARWGKGSMSRPIDRRHVEVLSMEEFNRIKDQAWREDQAWFADAEKRYWAEKSK